MRWDAGGLFGRNTISTTFHREAPNKTPLAAHAKSGISSGSDCLCDTGIKVPFQKSIHVQARFAGKGCHESYFNVRRYTKNDNFVLKMTSSH